MAPKPKLSREERLKRKREREKQRRLWMKDEDTVYKSKILYRVPPPTDFQRYKKFSVHFSLL